MRKSFLVPLADKGKTATINQDSDGDNITNGGVSDNGGDNGGTNKEKTKIDRVAYAVAMAETHNCTLGYGKMYNNCFGIKSGNTAPCEKVGKNRMCIYEKPEQSYEAFKKIWTKWYGGGLPTWSGAAQWTGNKNPTTWVNNVNHYYYNQ